MANNVNEENSNTIVVVDAGHGGEDGGAVGINGINEKEINLAIAQKLVSMLNQSGIETYMIRNGDYSVGNNELNSVAKRKSSDIKERVRVANSTDNSILVSIHQNFFTEEKYSGLQVFYSKTTGSKELAESIQSSVINLAQPENDRLVKAGDKRIYLLNNATHPAIIVECGFISNLRECNLLCSDNYRNTISYSIAIGIMKFLNNPL